MPDYMMFDKSPGGVPVNRDEHALLLGNTTPDVVRLPANLGGQVVKVVEVFTAPCPVRHVPCRHLRLENGVCVAESDQFYWYRPKAQGT
jgi:hypothetical protein